MTQIQKDDWEIEFPFVSFFRRRSAWLGLFVEFEKFVRRVVFIIVWCVIVYFIYEHASKIGLKINNQSATSRMNSNISDIHLWRIFTNKLYKLMFFDLFLIISLGFFYIKNAEIIKVLRMLYNWSILIVFISFSYAISQFSIDVINLALAFGHAASK